LPLGQPSPFGGSGQVLHSASPPSGQSDQLPAPAFQVDVVCAKTGFDSVSEATASQMTSQRRSANECAFAILNLFY
jgi:hypothetical protein